MYQQSVGLPPENLGPKGQPEMVIPHPTGLLFSLGNPDHGLLPCLCTEGPIVPAPFCLPCELDIFLLARRSRLIPASTLATSFFLFPSWGPYSHPAGTVSSHKPCKMSPQCGRFTVPQHMAESCHPNRYPLCK